MVLTCIVLTYSITFYSTLPKSQPIFWSQPSTPHSWKSMAGLLWLEVLTPAWRNGTPCCHSARLRNIYRRIIWRKSRKSCPKTSPVFMCICMYVCMYVCIENRGLPVRLCSGTWYWSKCFGDGFTRMAASAWQFFVLVLQWVLSQRGQFEVPLGHWILECRIICEYTIVRSLHSIRTPHA